MLKSLADTLTGEPVQLPSPTMADLIAKYKTEKMPTRKCTAQTYSSWLDKHILPTWGSTLVSEMQPRPVELWLRELSLAPKSKAHIRNLLHTLLDFAMWSDVLPLARYPMSLIVVKGASKRIRQPRKPDGRTIPKAPQGT